MRLPPLNALRAFEAAARHGSLVAAARELHRTHGAVSRQVKALEDSLGRALFLRGPRGLRLTGEGLALAFAMQQAFETIGEAVRGMTPRRERRTVHIGTTGAYAARVLLPRLARFERDFPGVTLAITCSPTLLEFGPGRQDLAVRYGRGRWTGLAARSLGAAPLIVACAPALAAAIGAQRPEDLLRTRLLHDDLKSWSRWFAAADARMPPGAPTIAVDDWNVLIEAAIAGQGAVLLPEPVLRADLRAGRLVRPLPQELVTGLGYHVVAPRGTLDDPLLAEISAWLAEDG